MAKQPIRIIMASERIETWEAIAEYFPYALSTVKNKYAPMMLAGGFVFRSHPGQGKTPVIWTFKELIFAFISRQQITNKKV